MKAHIRVSHEGIVHTCPTCKKQFKHKHTLARHKREHLSATEKDDEEINGVEEMEKEYVEKKSEEVRHRKVVEGLVGVIPPRVTEIEVKILQNTL